MTIANEGTRCAALGRCPCSGPKMQTRSRSGRVCIFGPGSRSREPNDLRHSMTVLARHSLRQWHRRVWSCLVDVRAVLVVSAHVMIAQALETLTKAAGPHTSAQRGPYRPNLHTKAVFHCTRRRADVGALTLTAGSARGRFTSTRLIRFEAAQDGRQRLMTRGSAKSSVLSPPRHWPVHV